MGLCWEPYISSVGKVSVVVSMNPSASASAAASEVITRFPAPVGWMINCIKADCPVYPAVVRIAAIDSGVFMELLVVPLPAKLVIIVAISVSPICFA